MNRVDRTQRQVVMGWLLVAAGVVTCGVVIGFSVDRGEGLDAIRRLWPMMLLSIGFNVLIAWTGIWPETDSLAPDSWRPVLAFALACGAASTVVLLLRDQSVGFAVASGTTVFTGLTVFVAVSSWLTIWARSQRD